MAVSARRLAAWRVFPAKGRVYGDCGDGWGMAILADSSWYVGSWKSGQPEGLGTRYAPDGKIQEGPWKAGVFKPGELPDEGTTLYPFLLDLKEPNRLFADASGKVFLSGLAKLPTTESVRFHRFGVISAGGGRLAFSEGLAAVNLTGRLGVRDNIAAVIGGWGFIDAQGNWAVKPIYEKVEPYGQDGYACARVQGSVIWIDRKGKVMSLAFPTEAQPPAKR